VPRAIWTGAINFGLVNVPVRIYSAIEEHKLHFRFIHQKDESPIGYQKICKKEDKPVPDKEIVKAFEFKKDEFVYMSDKEGAEKVYSLLVRAMEDSELAAIAKFVMRDRQYLGALRVREGTITLEQLYFADEIRPVNEIRPRKAQVSSNELKMAAQLIDSFTGEWKPEQYKDTYRDALLEVIKAKRKGKEIHRAPEVEEEQPTDLLAALRASVDAARGGKRKAPSRNGGSANGDLEELSKAELDERARDAGISGRSKMSKQQLVEALSDAA
jgi:DNA end-binding protein Ku